MNQKTKMCAKSYLNLVEKIRSHKDISIKNFYIGPTLGNGTFGKVKQVQYRGVDSDFVFALKILKKEDLVKLNQVRVFLKSNWKVDHIKSEKSILMFVNHPFIYELVVSFQTRDFIYLLFEYLPGSLFVPIFMIRK